jgi:hypothetical protein
MGTHYGRPNKETAAVAAIGIGAGAEVAIGRPSIPPEKLRARRNPYDAVLMRRRHCAFSKWCVSLIRWTCIVDSRRLAEAHNKYRNEVNFRELAIADADLTAKSVAEVRVALAKHYFERPEFKELSTTELLGKFRQAYLRVDGHVLGIDGQPILEQSPLYQKYRPLHGLSWSKRWGNRPASLWIAEDFGCCASGWWWNVVRGHGLKHQKEKRSMDHFAGLDVSVKEASVCIVDDTGKIIREVWSDLRHDRYSVDRNRPGHIGLSLIWRNSGSLAMFAAMRRA